MKQIINELIAQIKADFPDLAADPDSVQYGYIQKLKDLKAELYVIKSETSEITTRIKTIENMI